MGRLRIIVTLERLRELARFMLIMPQNHLITDHRDVGHDSILISEPELVAGIHQNHQHQQPHAQLVGELKNEYKHSQRSSNQTLIPYAIDLRDG